MCFGRRLTNFTNHRCACIHMMQCSSCSCSLMMACQHCHCAAAACCSPAEVLHASLLSLLPSAISSNEISTHSIDPWILIEHAHAQHMLVSRSETCLSHILGRLSWRISQRHMMIPAGLCRLHAQDQWRCCTTRQKAAIWVLQHG